MDIVIPKLGFSMTAGVLSEWLVADGAQVTSGEPLYSIESDKSVQEVEAPCDGTLRILKEAGEEYEVGIVIGTIE